MTEGKKQSFRHFTNHKQLRLSEDPNYPVEHLSGDASTDNRQYITEPEVNAIALETLQANSGFFMHPMHDVTQTEQVNGEEVLEALQQELDELERQFEGGDGRIDPNEENSRPLARQTDETNLL